MPESKPDANANVDTSWMQPAKVPETRACPKCDGDGQVTQPERDRMQKLIVELFDPIRKHLEKDGIDFDTYVGLELEERLKGVGCTVCKGTGKIPMEQPGDPSQISPTRGPEGLRHLLPGRR